MNWPFWKSAHSSPMDPCETIEPLLALFADHMTSTAEAGRVEAHLRECVSCRDTLLWMQATHRTLASRPVALPPPDLRARIAEAIAASDQASIQPTRVFKLRPAYAAAASLTALGVFLIGHNLSAPHPATRTVTNAPRMASLPPVIAPQPTIVPTLKPMPVAKHSLPASRHDERMADSTPPEEAQEKSQPQVIIPSASRAHVSTVAITGSHPLSIHLQKQSVIVLAERPKAEKFSDHIPALSSPTLPTHTSETASAAVPPTVSIGAPKILTVEPAPSISVASLTQNRAAHIQNASLLESVQDYAMKHSSSMERNLTLASNKAIHGAVYRTAITSGLESPVSIADIHSP